ncbi:hypothetical protein O181_105489 [Austropuccinia psidii MF-1]|uniref:Uncharacterized protein n=1 Tax=Austropuccinia psidii MF-1 TaxID=1389203 RepID=A0A9Q3PL53_9BASI|nr:hypothetical protein [Austropuccinia psidii MF-1]
MAHIIHLAACNGLNALGHEVSSDIEVNQQSSELIAPIAISNLINPPDGQHMSPQRQEMLIGTVNLLYDRSQLTNETTLLTPVSTLWNSTDNMLK